MKFKQQTTLFGKKEVVYNCPAAECGHELVSPLEEAGQDDYCPECGCSFVVPGIKIKLEQERLAAEAANAKQQKAEARQARAVVKAEVAKLQQVADPVPVPPVAQPLQQTIIVQGANNEGCFAIIILLILGMVPIFWPLIPFYLLGIAILMVARFVGSLFKLVLGSRTR